MIKLGIILKYVMLLFHIINAMKNAELCLYILLSLRKTALKILEAGQLSNLISSIICLQASSPSPKEEIIENIFNKKWMFYIFRAHDMPTAS